MAKSHLADDSLHSPGGLVSCLFVFLSVLPQEWKWTMSIGPGTLTKILSPYASICLPLTT